MKVLSKMNRGVIFTVVVLLGVVAYLIGLEVTRSSARGEIQQICESYIAAELKYHMLPETYRAEKPEVSQEELDSYLTAMRKELKEFYVDNEQTYRYKLEELENDLIAQSQGEGVVYQFEKELVEYEIEFNGNTASVTLTCMTTYDGPVNSYKEGMGLSSRQTLTGETADRFTFQQIDGEWKLTYAALYEPAAVEAYTSYIY